MSRGTDGWIPAERRRAVSSQGAVGLLSWAPRQRCCPWARWPEPSVQTDTCCSGGAGAVSVSPAPGLRPRGPVPRRPRLQVERRGGSDLWGGTSRDACVPQVSALLAGPWGLGPWQFALYCRANLSPLLVHTRGDFAIHPLPPAPTGQIVDAGEGWWGEHWAEFCPAPPHPAVIPPGALPP